MSKITIIYCNAPDQAPVNTHTINFMYLILVSLSDAVWHTNSKTVQNNSKRKKPMGEQ
jgi:hypothetical protein